jgi:hypothetical protein
MDILVVLGLVDQVAEVQQVTPQVVELQTPVAAEVQRKQQVVDLQELVVTADQVYLLFAIQRYK